MFFDCNKVHDCVGYFYELCEFCRVTVSHNGFTFITQNFEISKSHILQFVCLLIKQYLYRCRCQYIKPSPGKLKTEIEYIYALELFNAKKEFMLNKFVAKWRPIFPECS